VRTAPSSTGSRTSSTSAPSRSEDIPTGATGADTAALSHAHHRIEALLVEYSKACGRLAERDSVEDLLRKQLTEKDRQLAEKDKQILQQDRSRETLVATLSSVATVTARA